MISSLYRWVKDYMILQVKMGSTLDYLTVERIRFPSLDCIREVSTYRKLLTHVELNEFTLLEMEIETFHKSAEDLKLTIDAACGMVSTDRPYKGTKLELRPRTASQWVLSSDGSGTTMHLISVLDALHELYVLIEKSTDEQQRSHLNGYYYRIAYDALMLIKVVRESL